MLTGSDLRCDVFMPPEDRIDLPGWGTALIRYTAAPGLAATRVSANMMQVNKYFASQGYTVFDLQTASPIWWN